MDFTLRVGNVSEKVEVTGEAPLVETSPAVISELVDNRKILDLPLNGRDFVQLALLQPGVVHGLVQAKNTSRGYGTKISVAGARIGSNQFLMDGVDIADSEGNTPGAC